MWLCSSSVLTPLQDRCFIKQTQRDAFTALTWGFDRRLTGRQLEGVSACGGHRKDRSLKAGAWWRYLFPRHPFFNSRTVSRLFLSCGSGHVSYLLQGTCCVGMIQDSLPFCWESQSDSGSTSALCILGGRRTELGSELYVLTSRHLQISQS